jgi:hypothetical protein
MTIDTTIAPRASAGSGSREVRPGEEFTAVVGDELEIWRVVAVLGIRVLAERVAGGDRHTFTLRFVRYRLALADDGGV